MRIFISHSTDDLKTVRQIAGYLRPHVDKVRFWDQEAEPGKDILDTVLSWIDLSDLVLVIVTDETFSRGPNVAKELGYAKGKNKEILALVRHDIEEKQLKWLQDVDSVRVDTDNLQPAFEAIAGKINNIRKKKFVNQGVLWAIAGLIGGLVLFGSDENDDE